jgi:non-lysosomal glucosylceramidase
MHVLMSALLLLFASAAWGGDAIPKTAWKRPPERPLVNPGVTRVVGDIDDGYWQGVPVGGFGAVIFPPAIAATLHAGISRPAS